MLGRTNWLGTYYFLPLIQKNIYYKLYFFTDDRKVGGIGNSGADGGATSKVKRTLKKVNLAVVKQRKKDNGNLELMKTLDEYVSANHN